MRESARSAPRRTSRRRSSRRGPRGSAGPPPARPPPGRARRSPRSRRGRRVGPELELQHGAHRGLHGAVVRRPIGREEDLAVPFEAEGQRHRDVAPEEPARPGERPRQAEVAARGERVHPEPERLEPAVGMRGPVREPAEPDGLGHQPEVLDHHPLLDRGELGHQALEVPDREDPPLPRIVGEMAASAPGEPGEPGWPEPGALVDDEGAGRLPEDLENAVEIEEREVVDRQEVRPGRIVEGPAIHVEVERWREGAAGRPARTGTRLWR